MSHRCPDPDAHDTRVPCCLFAEGDCMCDYEDQCRQINTEKES